MSYKKIPMIAFLILLAGLLLAGCSSDDDDPPAVAGDSSSKPDDSDGSKPPVDNGDDDSKPDEDNDDDESTQDSSSIEGRWETQCIETKEGGGKIGFEFKGKAVTMVVGEYSDNSCSQTPKTTGGKGKFVFGKAVTTSSGLSANELDINLDNRDPILSLVAVNRKKMSLALDFDGKRPSDLDPSIELDKIGGTGGTDGTGGTGGTGSGRDCEPCKSQSDCGGGTECATFGDGTANETTLCALPETQECPI